MRRECRERFSPKGMHHGTCVTHVPWCMSGLLTRGGGKMFPAFPAHAQSEILHICQEGLHIWQEAHALISNKLCWRSQINWNPPANRAASWVVLQMKTVFQGMGISITKDKTAMRLSYLYNETHILVKLHLYIDTHTLNPWYIMILILIGQIYSQPGTSYILHIDFQH